MKSKRCKKKEGILAALAIGILSVIPGICANASDAVTVDFVKAQDFEFRGEKKPDQTDYLYYDDGVGGWLEFTVPEISSGDYDVSVTYKTHDKCGVFQTSIDEKTVGNPVDQNGNNSGDITTELGKVTIEDKAEHKIRLEALENEYKAYRMTVKSITLTPVKEEGGEGSGGDKPIPEIDFGEKQVSESGNVEAWPMPYVYEASSDFTLKVDGVDVPVTKYFGWYDYANFSMKGTENGGAPVTVEITYNENITSYDISPQKLGMTGEVNGNKLTFQMERDEYLIIRINGKERRLVLLADPWETEVPASSGEGIFNVFTDYEADRTGTNLATEKIQKAIDDASAYGTEHGKRGIVYIPIGVYEISTLDLKSNVEVYLEGGAALRLTLDSSQYRQRGFKNSIGKPVLHMLHTYNNVKGDPYQFNEEEWKTIYQNPENWVESVNIKLHGRGTIDARGEEVDRLGWLSETLAPQNCQNFISDGLIYRESGVWSINVSASNDLEFTNLKVLNKIFHENDCIDINNSQNVVVRNAFGSALDDPYSTKTWRTEELFYAVCGEGEPLQNVVFEDCIAWTCCYGFKVGQGSWYTQDNVTFKDGVVYDCSVGVGIEHKYGSAELKNITFENIDIERVGNSNGPLRNWLAFQSVSGSDEGTDPISNVTVKNVKVYDPGTQESRIVGYDRENKINGITFEKIYMDHLQRNAATMEELNVKERYLYADNITIDGVPVKNAPAPVTYLFENMVDSAEKSGNWEVGIGGGFVYAGEKIGDWISFPIQVDTPGTYELSVVMKHHESKGIFQTYVNGEKLGEPYDQYGKNQEKVSIKIGEVTFDEPGKQIVKFEIVGKNELSKAYQMVLNGVTLSMKEDIHIHEFGTEWKQNEKEHWHECACGEKSEVEEHISGEWIIDIEATELSEGKKHKECTVCGYRMKEESIPVIEPEQNPEEDNQKPSDDQKPTVPNKGNNTNHNSVETGDSSQVMIWVLVMAGAISTLAGVLALRRKNNR